MNNYKEDFADKVTETIELNIEDRTKRMVAVGELIDTYVEAHGVSPDEAQLDRLSDYILREELTNTDRMKTRKEEYPFLSERQFERRRENEVPLEVAEEYAVDGRNYRLPKRRKRSTKELIYVDENARIRNELRAKRYKRDTSPGALMTYNLNESGGEFTESFVSCRGLGKRWLNEMSAVNDIEVVTEKVEQLTAA
ncbi:hypothetical protein MJ749_14815 [Paenibacillus polymyxa]|uniref:hypothetical protein n=1 Tax=Paenibacillus polymyxa TaxID=1406 RepID=UPI0006973C2D|nr:hypothetical protein [Paenibacillus polymyxa]UMR33968.1 hypothetical protein MJ749_14815 [Paenibacillus polymyxa]